MLYADTTSLWNLDLLYIEFATYLIRLMDKLLFDCKVLFVFEADLMGIPNSKKILNGFEPELEIPYTFNVMRWILPHRI